jgi:tetratricopeptide (TPR) repeat protein
MRIPPKAARVVFLSVLFFFALDAPCDSLDSTFSKANNAFWNGDYAKAAELYEKIEDLGARDAVLSYNLGTAYARLGKLGMAVRHYERALRLDPGNSDAMHNLSVLRGRAQRGLGPGGEPMACSAGSLLAEERCARVSRIPFGPVFVADNKAVRIKRDDPSFFRRARGRACDSHGRHLGGGDRQVAPRDVCNGSRGCEGRRAGCDGGTCEHGKAVFPGRRVPCPHGRG